MTLELPFPPTVNTYWRRVGSRTLISEGGRKYRRQVLDHVMEHQIRSGITEEDRLRVTILAYPPDERRRDLDNLPKGLLDALAKAGVYPDDSQIDELAIRRGEVRKPGRVLVKITVLEDAA